MPDSLTLLLPDLVALIQAHFHPLEARVNFPGSYNRLDNIKVVDAAGVLRRHFTATSQPSVSALLATIVFEREGEVELAISDPEPDPDDEEVFRYELVARFDIPDDLDPEFWLEHPAGRRAWGEWTTWHDHHRQATLTLIPA